MIRALAQMLANKAQTSMTTANFYKFLRPKNARMTYALYARVYMLNFKCTCTLIAMFLRTFAAVGAAPGT